MVSVTTLYYTAVSIDGFVADADNSLDWLVGRPSSPEQEQRFGAFFGGIGAMAMGATTYEWVLEYEKLLEKPGNVWVMGGGNIAGQFAAAGLIDQLIMGITPVTLGAGARLLPWRSPGDLRLVGIDQYADFVQLTYDLPAAG
jgi:dihydrofolate reductase